jgi:hypothetical protein
LYRQCRGSAIWLRIEDYLLTQNNADLSKEKLKRIEEAIIELHATASEAKARGTALPSELANESFMRKLYSLNDENLSVLFLKHFQAPRASIFDQKSVPKIITDREQMSTQLVRNLLERAEKEGKNLPLKIVLSKSNDYLEQNKEKMKIWSVYPLDTN